MTSKGHPILLGAISRSFFCIITTHSISKMHTTTKLPGTKKPQNKESIIPVLCETAKSQYNYFFAKRCLTAARKELFLFNTLNE